MPTEERERHTLVGSHSQASGSEAQPKRQLFDFGAVNDKRTRDRRRKKVRSPAWSTGNLLDDELTQGPYRTLVERETEDERVDVMLALVLSYRRPSFWNDAKGRTGQNCLRNTTEFLLVDLTLTLSYLLMMIPRKAL